MNYSVKFYPEKRKDIDFNVPVMLSVTYSRQRMFYYTGLRCDVKQWDTQESRLKRNQITLNDHTTLEFNAELTKITNAVNDLFKVYEIRDVLPSPAELREDLKSKLGKGEVRETEKIDFFSRFDQYINDAPLSAERKRHLKTILKKVKAFNPNTSYDNLDVQYLTDFHNHLMNVKLNSRNTAISEIKGLRAFYGHSNKHGWTANYPFKSFSIDTESFGDPVFITVEERDKLYSADLQNEILSQVRDIFVFQCFIGCRVGDLLKLKKSNMVGHCIEYIASKTRDDKPRIARVPLSEKAKAILAKYDLPDGELLPFLSSHQYNINLKLLFKSVGLTRMVTIADPNTRQTVQKSIADIASSHMARRVFVGNLHRKGVKNEIIASMSGHVENSKAFSRYYNINQEDQHNAIKLIE